MITNTAFETYVCYYPLGNTPPVSLAQDLPPEQDADILLLGCGDARNILFTCFVDNARRMDVTCCDIEPGIQARNVLLYSLLIDDKLNLNVDRIWNIYYHWSLDDDSVELLETQIEKLLQHSKSIVEWHNSVYGSTIRFCDEMSLSRVKSYWSNFSSRGLSPASNEERLRQLKNAHARAKSFRTEMLNGGINLNYFRGTLPAAYAQAPQDLSEIAVHWWTHGTLPLRSGPASKSIHLNPTFFYSPNSALTLHFGISPLSGFPLSIANTPIEKTCPLSIEKNGLSSKDRLVASAKCLFSNWASAFRRVSGKNVLIRIFCGDAVHFCFTLASECDKSSPTKFDCIDTSNLGDPLGPLNLLTLGSVLLKKRPSSSLYTEMLVQHYSNVKDRFTESMGCDARTVALLLGLVCPDMFTNATNCVEEDTLNIKCLQRKTGRGVSQERSRFRWKRINSEPNEAAHMHAEAETLAKFFIDIHYEMFRYERPMEAFSEANTMFGKFLTNSANPRYNRGSFAFLLSIVKSNVSTDWDKCLKLICDEVCRSRVNPFGSFNASDELLLHMRSFGVYRSGALKLEPEDLSNDLIARALNLNEKSPDTLCVTLRVPRENLKVIMSRRCCPIIVGSITGKDPRGSQWESYFSSVHVAFGEWSERSDKNSSNPCFVEDSRQQSGTSDMFVSFFVPTKLLLKAKHSVPVVRCQLQRTHTNIANFMDELGSSDLCLVRKEITSNDVSITQFIPGMSVLPSYLALNLSRTTASDLVTLRFSDDSSKVKTLVKRIDLQSDAAKVLAVKSSPVKVEFKSPLLAIVTVANSFKFEFRFPCPVSVSSNNYKVRFGRTSSFIEVESPLLDPLEEDVASFMFPTSLTNGTSDVTLPTSWIATYIDMDAMPQIDITNTRKLEWLNHHLLPMLFRRERSAGASDTRTEFKRSLYFILAKFTGLQGKKVNIFGLKKKDSPAETIIIPSCLRLDLVNHSVVLDCAVLPRNHIMYNDNLLAIFLMKITPTTCAIDVGEAENRAWKALLPAFTERCRTNTTWTHGPNCEYVKKGEIPLAAALIQSNVSPICTCGVGKFPAEGFLSKLKEKYPELNHVLKRYATRAAIAPVFSVPYVEDDFLAGISSIVKSMGTIDICQSCGCNKRKNDEEKQNSLLTCSRCKAVKYCSTDCQKADWKLHKLSCGK
nr:PREDICTED: uncharacterized protein LOC109035832 isoform X3 [Bemisia tabaci]